MIAPVSLFGIVLPAVLALALTVLIFVFVIRPWYLNWGSTPEEAARALPGDELVPLAQTVTDSGKAVDHRRPLPARYLKNSLVVVLEPRGPRTTRMLVRDRVEHNAKLSPVWSLIEPGVFLQESRFMLGVKARAEGALRR